MTLQQAAGARMGQLSETRAADVGASPCRSRLPEIDTQPYEHIDDFPVAGLHRSFKGAEGFILGFWQLRQEISGDDLRGLD
jgi:hypothetical protein